MLPQLQRYHSTVFVVTFGIALILSSSFEGYSSAQEQAEVVVGEGSRPAYIYDYADILSAGYEGLLDEYVRRLDDTTTAEVVVYTIPSFIGHGIKKDGQEIQDRDMLANYIFNELSLDRVKGIGKQGKDNGILLLISLERDAGGGSIRLEIGRGLEGDVTDGTAGLILSTYLAPARAKYEDSGDVTVFDDAIFDTVVAVGERIGYFDDDPIFQPTNRIDYTGYQAKQDYLNNQDLFYYVIIFIIISVVIAALSIRHGRRTSSSGSWIPSGGGGFGGGGSGGGGGGGSGGGGAGR